MMRMARLVTINLRSKIEWTHTRMFGGLRRMLKPDLRNTHTQLAAKRGYTHHWGAGYNGKKPIYHGE